MARIIVVGAGLVGPVLAMDLAKSGHRVEVWERRPDPRRSRSNGGSSVNLTLCARGLAALNDIGLEQIIRGMCVPVYGRFIHDAGERTMFQAYGSRGEAIFSISRAELNRTVINCAERLFGIPFRFGYTCVEIDPHEPSILFEESESGNRVRASADVICAADGVHSAVRTQLHKQGLLDYSARAMEQGYKEINIPAADRDDWRARTEVLHLWPRRTHMLIAFPNTGGDFTGALHLPLAAPAGEISFESVREPADLLDLFEDSFPDVLPYVENLVEDCFSRPVNRMTTIHCSPWHINGKVILLGDAAHSIYPIYGQGANAGFEDCRTLTKALRDYSDDWSSAAEKYGITRKRDMDAMAELCVSHAFELRDHALDRSFQLRKDVERKVNELLPESYIPLYSMISFTLMPYAEAIRIGREQEAIIERLMKTENLEAKLSSTEFERLVIEAVDAHRGTTNDCQPFAGCNVSL